MWANPELVGSDGLSFRHQGGHNRLPVLHVCRQEKARRRGYGAVKRQLNYIALLGLRSSCQRRRDNRLGPLQTTHCLSRLVQTGFRRTGNRGRGLGRRGEVDGWDFVTRNARHGLIESFIRGRILLLVVADNDFQRHNIVQIISSFV